MEKSNKNSNPQRGSDSGRKSDAKSPVTHKRSGAEGTKHGGNRDTKVAGRPPIKK